MLKKCLSVLLSLVMLCSIFSIFPISVSAQEVDIAEAGANAEIAETGITQDQAVQWIKDRANEGWWQDVDGVYGCQCVDLIQAYYQYFGYGRLGGNAGDYMYNHLPSGSDWYYSDTPIPGSVFVRNYDNNYYPYGHVGLVYAVDGSTMYTVETNVVSPYDGGSNSSARYRERSVWFANRFINPTFTNPVPKPSNVWFSASHRALPIGWDITFNFGADNAEHFDIGIDRNGTRIITETVSSGKSYHFTDEGDYSAYVTAYNSSGYVDSNRVSFTVYRANNLGEKFTAAILNTATGVAVTVGDDNRNVVVKQYKGTDDQLWLFERNGAYRNYKITNLKTGYCLDDVDFGTSDNTNIIARPSNDSDAERWYIRTNGSGYSIVPKCASHGCIDMVGGNSSDGNNIAMWTCVQGNGNQIFTLQMVDKPAYTGTFNGHKYELYNTSIAWKEAFQFCQQQGGHLVTVNSKEEQEFINSILSSSTHNRIWAGGLDTYTEGKWQWITGETFSYKNWGSGEPNNSGDEDYLMLSRGDGKWNDVADVFNNTDNNYSFICEYDDVIDSTRTKLEKSFDYNNHRYEIYSGYLDWLSAKLLCEQKGGHLVTITTAEENSTIANNIKTLNHEVYWLGLTDVEHESKWHWITDEAYSYKNWSDKEPNNSDGTEDYAVYVSASGKWNDLTGRSVVDKAFICEYDTIEITDDMVTVKDVITTSDADTVTPQVTVKWNNTTLKVNTDYTVNATADINNGIGSVTVTGKGIYSGTVTKTFKITINDTTVVNDFFGNKFETEKGEIITYYANLTSPIQVNYLRGIIYYNQEVLEPILTDDIGYNVPEFENGSIMPMGAGQIRFDAYSSKPVNLNNVMVIRMQFRVIKKGGETWLGHQFETPEFTYENRDNYELEAHILTDQVLYDPSKMILGDANGDGEVDSVDATIVQRAATKIQVPYSEEQLMCADIDGDGSLTIVDATFIQRYDSRIAVPYPVGEAK